MTLSSSPLPDDSAQCAGLLSKKSEGDEGHALREKSDKKVGIVSREIVPGSLQEVHGRALPHDVRVDHLKEVPVSEGGVSEAQLHNMVYGARHSSLRTMRAEAIAVQQKCQVVLEARLGNQSYQDLNQRMYEEVQSLIAWCDAHEEAMTSCESVQEPLESEKQVFSQQMERHRIALQRLTQSQSILESLFQYCTTILTRQDPIESHETVESRLPDFKNLSSVFQFFEQHRNEPMDPKCSQEAQALKAVIDEMIRFRDLQQMRIQSCDASLLPTNKKERFATYIQSRVTSAFTSVCASSSAENLSEYDMHLRLISPKTRPLIEKQKAEIEDEVTMLLEEAKKKAHEVQSYQELIQQSQALGIGEPISEEVLRRFKNKEEVFQWLAQQSSRRFLSHGEADEDFVTQYNTALKKQLDDDLVSLGVKIKELHPDEWSEIHAVDDYLRRIAHINSFAVQDVALARENPLRAFQETWNRIATQERQKFFQKISAQFPGHCFCIQKKTKRGLTKYIPCTFRQMLGRGTYKQAWMVQMFKTTVYADHGSPRSKTKVLLMPAPDVTGVVSPEREFQVCSEILDEAQFAKACIQRGEHQHLALVQSVIAPNGTTIYSYSDVCAGGELDQYMRREGGHLSQYRRCSMILELLHGMASVHQLGYVHSDMKDANVFDCT